MNAESRSIGIDQVIFAIEFVDVHIIVVAPIGRPRIDVRKPVSAVVEAPIISPLDTETVGASEVGPEVFLANASSVAVSVLALLLGVLLVPKLGADRTLWIRRQWLAFGSVLLLVLLGAHFIANLWRG